MSFGKRLKNLRIEKNLTQQQLAEKLNVSKANISKYESDIIEPNINLINRISIGSNSLNSIFVEINVVPHIKMVTNAAKCPCVSFDFTLSPPYSQLL